MIANQQTFLVKNEPYLLFKGQLYDLEHNSYEDEVNGNLSKKCKFVKETVSNLDEDAKAESKKELSSKVKKITCKLRMVNLQIAEQQDDLIENSNKDTQGDILNKLKWTRSRVAQANQDKLTEQVRSSLIKSNKNLKNLDIVNKVLDCDEQTKELFK